jgi:hypothetical protein
MIVPSSRFIVLLALLDRPIQCYPSPIRQCNRAFWPDPARSQAAARYSFGWKPQPDDDHVAVTFETVISGYGLGMLSGDHRASKVKRFA